MAQANPNYVDYKQRLKDAICWSAETIIQDVDKYLQVDFQNQIDITISVDGEGIPNINVDYDYFPHCFYEHYKGEEQHERNNSR